MWSKTGKNYTVEGSDSQTIFNLDGTIIKQGKMSQEDAVSFLELNGYGGFKIDASKPAKKVGEKINGKDSGDLKEKLDFS